MYLQIYPVDQFLFSFLFGTDAWRGRAQDNGLHTLHEGTARLRPQHEALLVRVGRRPHHAGAVHSRASLLAVEGRGEKKANSVLHSTFYTCSNNYHTCITHSTYCSLGTQNLLWNRVFLNAMTLVAFNA